MATIKELKASFTAKANGMKSTIQAVVKDIEGLGKRTQEVARKINDDINNVGKKMDEVGKSATKSIAGTLENAFGSANKSARSLSDTTSATANSLSGLGNISSSVSTNLTGTSTAISNLANGSTVATKEISSTSDSLNNLSGTAAKSGQGMAGVAGSMSNLLSTSTATSSGLGAVNGTMSALLNSSANATSGVQSVSDSLNNVSGSADNAANANRRAAQEAESIGQSSSRASFSIKEMATALGLVAAASKVFSMLKSAIDSAIARFDTLAGFPVVMERMGFSSEEASGSIKKLSEGIQGLPTTLNGIVASTQRIAVLTGDLDTATDTALSLNNAFLASGSSAANAERGLTQYVQMLSKGSVDIMSWRTLQETMGYALKETAEAFEFAGDSAQNDLYAALKAGDIPFKEFNEKIIELNDGVGGFADMAATGSEGIATSLGNLRNAFVVGVAGIITTIDKLSHATTGKSIYKNIDSLKVVVSSSFKVINSAVESSTPVVVAFISAVQATTPVVKALTPVILGSVAAFAAYTAASKAAAAITAAKVAIAAATASGKALTIATQAQIAAQITMTTVDRAGTVATVANTSAVTLSTYAIGVMTGTITLSTAAKGLAAGAAYALGAAWQFMLGPVGWITAGIGLLVAGTIALVKWFNKSTEEGAKLAGQTKDLADATDSLNSAVKDSGKAYEKRQKSIASNAEFSAKLAKEIEELAAVEGKSAAQKKELNSYIEELNRNVAGLNLVYGEESNALSLSSEQMANRIALMKEEESLQASHERLAEIAKEENDIGLQRKEVNALIEESNQLFKDGVITKKEHKEAVKGLEEQEVALSAAHTAAGAERVRVENEITESSAAVADALEQDIGRQLKMYEELPDSVKAVVDSMQSSWEDYASAATEMFDRLSEKSEVSIGEMTKNLEENQRIIGAWGDNIAKLAERGIDEGLLETLRSAGPEAAGLVNNLVNSSDTELAKLSETFAKGGDVATKALSTSLGIEDSGVLDAVGHLVNDTKQGLGEAIQNADFASLGVDIAKGSAQGIEKGTPAAEKAAEAMAKAIEDAAREESETRSPSKVFERFGGDLIGGTVLGLINGIPNVIAAAKQVIVDLLKPFDGVPKQFEVVGKDVVAGFNRGLVAGKAQVMATARSLAASVETSMRKELDTHSPSKKTYKIATDSGDGFVKGLKKSEKAIESAAKKAAKKAASGIKKGAKSAEAAARKAAKAAADKFKEAFDAASFKYKMDEVDSTEYIKSLEKVKKEYAKTPAQIRKVSLEIKKITDKAAKEQIDSVKRLITDKRALEQISLEEEVVIWAESVKQFENGTDQKRAAMLALRDAKRAVDKKMLDDELSYIDKMKKLGKLSLQDELKLLGKLGNKFTNDESNSKFQAVNERRLDVIKRINTETDKLNKKNLDDTRKINDDLIKEIQRVNDEYQKEEDNRRKQIFSFKSLFEEAKVGEEVSGGQLSENLDSQVRVLQQYQAVINELQSKGISGGLLGDLQDAGPNALAELQALNRMRESELTKYAQTYQHKYSLASNQAQIELKGSKKDAEDAIEDMRYTANQQLNELQKEWVAQMAALTTATDEELSTLEQVGINAGKSLLDGLSSVEFSLVDKARSIAHAVREAMNEGLGLAMSASDWAMNQMNVPVGSELSPVMAGAPQISATSNQTADKSEDVINPDAIYEIEIPVEIDGEVIARKTVKYTARELLNLQNKRR